MEDISKNILINELFDIYGVLLSTSQQKMISLYYGLDLSLSEIAEQEHVSRNAVYDALKKGSEALIQYEEKLNLLKRKQTFDEKLNSLEQILTKEDYLKVLNVFKEEE